MKRLLAALLVLGYTTVTFADPRTNPPTIQKTSPAAVARGLAVEVKVEGINLVGATGVLFDDPAITGRILHVNALGEFIGKFIGSNGLRSTVNRGDPPPLSQVTMEVKTDAEARVGLYRFRLVTKEGTTNTGMVSVEPFYGARPEIEPNDTLQEALLQVDYVFPPTIITGKLGEPGDVDHLRFDATAGDELVAQITAAELGSKLRWSMELLDEKGVAVARKSVAYGDGEPVLAYRVPADGTYFLAVSDVERGGGGNHFYRMKIGHFPYLTGVYPLGVPGGEETQVSLHGHNLGDQRTVMVEGKSDYESMAHHDLRPDLDLGTTHNELKLAIGEHPETSEVESGADAASAMDVAVGTTINGRVSGFADSGATADEDYFRFEAKKDKTYVMEVEARRLGSPLDSVLEVLNSEGKRISQLTARAEVKTGIELRDHNSVSEALRISLPIEKGFEVGDYVMIGNEILRISALPRGPDDGTRFTAFGGQRIGYFNTTPEARALLAPVYRVSLHPPHAKFQPNGLPLKQFYYRNDDGGPGYDKDSRLQFTAPRDGAYLVRLRDLRGLQGEDFAYRLTVREAKPDFLLALNPPNPNVPRGGGATVTVNALRIDGFDRAIDVEVLGLPDGLSATRETIAAGETSTAVTLWADESAELEHSLPLEIVGKARIGGSQVARTAGADDRLRYIALGQPADIEVTVDTPEVALEAGTTTKVAVTVTRRNGFTGRVPVTILNLPFGVRVTDVGLNGVLITEDETRREFTLEALPDVQPTERLVHVTGTVETRSPLRPAYAARPFKLKVLPRTVAATDAARTSGSSAAR